MKDIFNNMISHPFKSMFIICAIENAVSNVICAVRGKAGTPIINIVVGERRRLSYKDYSKEAC